MRFSDITFDESFRFAKRDSGETLKFTPSEQALLRIFIQLPGQVLPRARLVEVTSHRGVDTLDRNIDFIVNRLRGKLGDSARKPQWIGTQYGEGYVWIAEPSHTAPAESFLVLGPIFGLDDLTPDSGARPFLDGLRRTLETLISVQRKVVLDEPPSRERNPSGRAPYAIEMSFHQDERGLHCAAVLRDVVSRRILEAIRLLILHADPAGAERQIVETAEALKAALWRRLSYSVDILAGPTDEPLELRMHKAALMLTRSEHSWLENEAQLARARADNPSDPETALMWAMHRYARLLLGTSAARLTVEARIALETEIETLVFESLPGIQDNPVLVLAAAKLLCFIDRGHLDLAEHLAEQAFALSTAFASAFAVLGQLRLCRGRLEEAREFFDKGIELAEPQSEFRVFLMVLKCTVLLAANDRAALEQAAEALYEIKPGTRQQIGLYIAGADEILPTALREQAEAFNLESARRAVIYFHYVFVRRLRVEAQRENMMRGFLAQVSRRLGLDFVPTEVWRSVPRLAPDTVALQQ